MSGENTTRSAAPKQKRKKVPGRKQGSPSVARQQTNGATKGKEEERSGFEDILGLVSEGEQLCKKYGSGNLTVFQGELTSSTVVESPEQPQQLPPAAVEEMQHQQLMMYEEAETQDDSLLTFEEDVEFDPLKRSDSVTRNNTALAKKGSLGKRPTVPAALDRNPSVPDSNAPHPPLTSQESLGHIQDLTGIDLTASSKTANSAQLLQQDSRSEILYPLQMTSAPLSMATPTPMNVMLTSSAGVMPHPSYPQGAAGIQLVSVSPAAVGQVGQVPLTLQAGGVGYGGGGAPAMVPVMYTTAQGAPGMMYQVS